MIVARTRKGRTTAVNVRPGWTLIVGFLSILFGAISLEQVFNMVGLLLGLFGILCLWFAVLWFWRGSRAL